MALLPGNGDFWVIEQGANDGSLARDILFHLRRRQPAREFARVRYGIVEPFSRLRERQEATLGEVFEGKLTHFADLGEARGRAERGIFLCNELLDAFPVHRVVREGGRWREIHVVEAGEGFAEAVAELSDPRLGEALAGVDVAEGYRTEICLGIDDWLAGVTGIFDHGLVTVIDYGLTEAAYFSPERNEGTLRAYRGHQIVENFYEGIGERDLTAHVNFTRVARSARANGMDVLGFTDQCFFLVGQAADWMREVQAAGAPDAATSRLLRQFQTLIHPGMMGRAFQVLTLGNNLPGDAAAGLSGFRHARNSLAELD